MTTRTLAGPPPAVRRRQRSVITLALSAAMIVTTLGATAGAGVHRFAPTASVVAADVKASLSIGTLPTNVSPTLPKATTDTALVDTPALSRCNTTTGAINLAACVFGDKSGKHTMVLWGDSHAFMWFPAVNAAAKKARWRLVAAMMLGCPVADVSVWNGLSHTPYTRCDTFRTKMIAAFNKMRPSLVILTEGFTAYAASGNGANNTISLAQWQAALKKTLRLLHAQKMKKVVLGSTISTGGASPRSASRRGRRPCRPAPCRTRRTRRHSAPPSRQPPSQRPSPS